MASLPKLGEITSRTFKAALGALPAVQVRWASNKNNSVSLLQQFYNKLPIRKKFRVALRSVSLPWPSAATTTRRTPTAGGLKIYVRRGFGSKTE
ncbi:unnamed protein product [Durusdinium trenchii]|uniref:Uncharacterized protein n=1 Tax=Durusdinium trenchii TaxID=1381693 RepID=A0ABP0I992_9DINO